jgi:hypothetical protein
MLHAGSAKKERANGGIHDVKSRQPPSAAAPIYPAFIRESNNPFIQVSIPLTSHAYDYWCP